MNKKQRISTVSCLRCGHIWVPRQEDIRVCPKCKSVYWDLPRKEEQVEAK